MTTKLKNAPLIPTVPEDVTAFPKPLWHTMKDSNLKDTNPSLDVQPRTLDHDPDKDPMLKLLKTLIHWLKSTISGTYRVPDISNICVWYVCDIHNIYIYRVPEMCSTNVENR